MVRLILIASAVFLAFYLLSRRFNASQKSNEAKDDVVSPRSGGFLIAFLAAVAIFSVIFICRGWATVWVVCFKKLSLCLLSSARSYPIRFSSSPIKGLCPLK